MQSIDKYRVGSSNEIFLPQPGDLDNLDAVGRQTFVAQLKHWRYLTTWNRGAPFVLKIRDLGDWKLVYDCVSEMSLGRRPVSPDTVAEEFFHREPKPVGTNLGWAYLSFVKATDNCFPRNILPRSLVQCMTEEQANLLDDASLMRIALANVSRLFIPLSGRPVGRQLLRRCTRQLPCWTLRQENYSTLVTSADEAAQLGDDALVICQALDLDSTTKSLITQELAKRQWDAATIRDRQRESAKTILAKERHHLISTPLCPLPFALELLFKTPQNDRDDAWKTSIQAIRGNFLFSWHGKAMKDIFTFKTTATHTAVERDESPKLPVFTKDLWQHLATFLTGLDILELARTCAALHNFIFCGDRSHLIWWAACNQEFPFLIQDLDEGNKPDRYNDKTYHRMWLAHHYKVCIDKDFSPLFIMDENE